MHLQHIRFIVKKNSIQKIIESGSWFDIRCNGIHYTLSYIYKTKAFFSAVFGRV